MFKATSEDWGGHYEGARQTRRASGGDPLEQYRERKRRQERRSFFGASPLSPALVTAFCTALVR
jgi:hypothetical protein